MTSSTPSHNHRHRPTSDPSSTQDSPSSTSINMTRSSSSEQGKVSKRKGTRSVSTLTAAQLSRKRANDREAQRAIRARTKDHIERLESELDELRGRHSRDHTVQELLRRNKALEDELGRLRDSMGVPVTASPYAKSIYDDNLSTASGAIPSPRTSPFPTGDYVHASSAGQLPDYAAAAAAGYVHFPPSCEAWTATIPAPVQQQQQQHSNVSSPSPSSVGADDFATSGQYLPTSAPMMPSSSMANALRTGEEIKMEYEDGNDHGFPLDRSPSAASSNGGTSPLPTMGPQSFMHHHQPHPAAPWGVQGMYTTYFQPVPSPVY